MFNSNYDKVTFRDLNDRIKDFKTWEIDGLEEDLKNLTQLVAMLISELGYTSSMGRNQVVTLNKNKK